MVRHAPIHRRSDHSDIAICCGRNVRGSSLSTSVVPLSNQVHHFESQTIQRIQNVFGRTLRVKHITIHHIVAGCCFRIGMGDNPLPARINSGIDYIKRCECITILGGVAGRGKGATGGSVGDRAHPNLARATAYYRRWPTSRPCLLAFRFTAATVLLIDLAIVVTGVFLRKWLFNSRKSSFVGGLNRSTQHFILKRKDGVYNGSKISSRFHRGGENGIMGPLAAWGVLKGDWTSIW